MDSTGTMSKIPLGLVTTLSNLYRHGKLFLDF